MSNHALYICYFGVREPLVQTQVLPYLREIKKISGLNISLLTFESDPNDPQLKTEQEKLAISGINLHCLTYHKSPSVPATIFDILNGVRFITTLNRREKIDILHARAHIPMLMAIMAEKVVKCRTIFDIRGLMAEEYADAGVWNSASKPFKFIKFIEKKGIEKASQIIVLTEKMRDLIVSSGAKNNQEIEVIPCCVSLERIDKAIAENEKNLRYQLIYAGSVTGLYLLREMGEFFLELKKQQKDAFFQVLTSSAQFVDKTFQQLGISEKDYSVIKVSPDEVPKYIRQSHLGISFRSPTFSQLAASPTKIPEYLAGGVPVITNSKIGDTTEQITEDRIGAIIESFTTENYRKGIEEIENLNLSTDLPQRCRMSAKLRFDVEEIGGRRYRGVYRKLLSSD